MTCDNKGTCDEHVEITKSFYQTIGMMKTIRILLGILCVAMGYNTVISHNTSKEVSTLNANFMSSKQNHEDKMKDLRDEVEDVAILCCGD